jgi:hypothetical protein
MQDLLVKGVGQADDVGGQPPLARLQGPPFGVGKAGEVERQQLREGALGLIEARLELARRGTQGRHGAGARGRHGAAGIAHERLAGGRVAGRAPGGQDGLGLPRAQAVTDDGVGHARLVTAGQRRQGGGRGRRQPPGVDVPDHVGGQPAAEGQAPVHPAPAAAEQLGDLGGREMIVVGQRADHAGLVHGAQGPPRGVGLEQARLADDADGVFHDHGHVGVAVADPVGEAFEAVEHLVGALTGRCDAQRQRGERAGGIGARPPQWRQRGGELRDGEIEDGGHAGGPSTGKSW